MFCPLDQFKKCSNSQKGLSIAIRVNLKRRMSERMWNLFFWLGDCDKFTHFYTTTPADSLSTTSVKRSKEKMRLSESIFGCTYLEAWNTPCKVRWVLIWFIEGITVSSSIRLNLLCSPRRLSPWYIIFIEKQITQKAKLGTKPVSENKKANMQIT